MQHLVDDRMPPPGHSSDRAATSSADSRSSQAGEARTTPPSAVPPDQPRTVYLLSPDPQQALIEAQVLSSIESEHFARLYRFLEIDQGAAVVIERVRGIDLRSLLSLLKMRRQGVREAVAVAILYQACRGLQDVIEGSSLTHHPGLHVANLRLSRSGTARWTGLEWRPRAPADSLLATPERLPPELAGGLPFPQDVSADLYGLAVVLYELLTGTSLHPTPSDASLEERRRTVATTPARHRLEATPELSAEVRTFLDRALHWDPRIRFTAPREMADTLGRLSTHLDPAMPLDMFAEQVYRVVRMGEDAGCLQVWLNNPVRPARADLRDFDGDGGTGTTATRGMDEPDHVASSSAATAPGKAEAGVGSSISSEGNSGGVGLPH